MQLFLIFYGMFSNIYLPKRVGINGAKPMHYLFKPFNVQYNLVESMDRLQRILKLNFLHVIVYLVVVCFSAVVHQGTRQYTFVDQHAQVE